MMLSSQCQHKTQVPGKADRDQARGGEIGGGSQPAGHSSQCLHSGSLSAGGWFLLPLQQNCEWQNMYNTEREISEIYSHVLQNFSSIHGLKLYRMHKMLKLPNKEGLKVKTFNIPISQFIYSRWHCESSKDQWSSQRVQQFTGSDERWPGAETTSWDQCRSVCGNKSG